MYTGWVEVLRENVTVAIPMCLKIRYKDYICQTHFIYFSCLSLHGRHFATIHNLILPHRTTESAWCHNSAVFQHKYIRSDNHKNISRCLHLVYIVKHHQCLPYKQEHQRLPRLNNVILTNKLPHTAQSAVIPLNGTHHTTRHPPPR